MQMRPQLSSEARGADRALGAKQHSSPHRVRAVEQTSQQLLLQRKTPALHQRWADAVLLQHTIGTDPRLCFFAHDDAIQHCLSHYQWADRQELKGGKGGSPCDALGPRGCI